VRARENTLQRWQRNAEPAAPEPLNIHVPYGDSMGSNSDINGQTPTSRASCGEELSMSLAIVWRNPVPLIRTTKTLHRVQGDQFGVVYAATDPNGTQQFRLECDRMAS
jgi:hypothetical protein